MPKLTEEEIETLCETFLNDVDTATAPEKMSIDEALDTWVAINEHISSAINTRVTAGLADLEK